MLVLYSFALFVSAVLLFSLEPMVGKMLLPRCGGTPAVWNTCMVFFQTVLLLGYAYSHWSTSFLGVRRQAIIHLAVIFLPLLVLPILFSTHANPPPNQDPSLWLLVQLTLVVGLPFFVISTTAPLLQRWFINTGHAGSSDPYFLYSTSNAGSLLALLSYPFLIEPCMGLLAQTYFWTAGYVLLILLIISCAAVMWIAYRPDAHTQPGTQSDGQQSLKSRDEDHISTSGPASVFGQRLEWVLLAFVPSSLMLGATTHITTDIASAPLLWVIPLVLYLLTFVIVFARKPIISHSLMIAAMPYAVLIMPLLVFGIPMKFWIIIPIHLATFFIVAMVCHGELARTRPGTSRLTEFYLWMSLGGVLGGMFNTLVAPQIFTSVAEYPLMLVAACFLRTPNKGLAKRTDFNLRDVMWLMGLIAVALAMIGITRCIEARHSFIVNSLVYGAPAVICFGFRERPIRFALGIGVIFLTVTCHVSFQSGDIIFAERDFYGVNRIRVMRNRFNALINGNVIHGIQEMYPTPRGEPLGYYSRSGPLGDLACAFDQTKAKRHVAIIGLGTGSIAAYARPGQRFTFYEIDPTVIRIATDARLFTYLKECPGEYNVITGDARIRLADAPDGRFDTIILDAFSSDSIPMHLLTTEALQLYCRKLKADGVLVLHISNKYLNLEPVLATLAEKNNLVCLTSEDLNVTPEEEREGKLISRYMVMARHMNDLGRLPENSRWHKPAPPAGVHEWTDDYSNILSVLCW